MTVKDSDLLNLIDKINSHFKQNINNRFLRKAFMLMEISQNTWEILEGIEEKAPARKMMGYQFEEIYDIVIAGATFIHNAKHDIQPRLKSLLEGNISKGEIGGPNDRILRDMAVSNFNSNLSIFTDQINELYMKTVNYDRGVHKNKNCIYEKIKELKQIGQLLVDS